MESREAAAPLNRQTRAMLWILAGLVCATYFWTAWAPGAPWFAREPHGYHNLQAAGFLAGHLHAAIEPHPALLALPDPYDPVANAPYRVHDMTLWNGKYYLYFGVAPILLLILPIRLLTGFYPAEFLIVPTFCSIGLLFALGALLEARQRYFPRAGGGTLSLLTAALGWGSPVLFLNQTVQFYQVAISCAVALGMAGLWALRRVWDPERRTVVWLAVAGSCLGLTLAARPNYLLGVGLTLVVTLLALAWRTGLPQAAWPRALWKQALAALGPAFLVGVGLLAYNALRFGNPLEFGMRYQLAGESFVDFTPLHPRYLPEHGAQYVWSPLVWKPYFPFIDSAPGSAFGVFRYLLLVWLATPLVWLIGRGRRDDAADPVLCWSAGLLALGFGNLVMVSCFFFQPMLRYTADFAPALLLAGAVGALLLLQRSGWPRVSRLLSGGTALVAVGVSGAVFIASQPAQRTSPEWHYRLNQPTAWWQRLNGYEHGPLRLVLQLPPGERGRTEPLVQSGYTADRRNWFFLRYLSPQEAEVVYFHAGLGELVSRPFPLPADGRLELELTSGMFLPPPGHPIFRRWSEAEMREARRTVEVRVHDEVVLTAAVEAYASNPADLEIGVLGFPRQAKTRETFRGTVLAQEKRPLQKPTLAPRTHELPAHPLQVQLLLPAIPAGFEPLLATGTGTSSDLIYLSYASSPQGPTVRFGFDHFGAGGPRSRALPYDPTAVHQLTLWTEAWPEANAPRGEARERVVILFNGEVALDTRVLTHPSAGQPLTLGENRHNAGSAGRAFNGRLLSVEEAPGFALPPPLEELIADALQQPGVIAFEAAFPHAPPGHQEPLLVSGTTGAADIVFVKYLDEFQLVFGFDHWGFGGQESAPLAVPREEFQSLQISLGPLLPDTAPAAARQRVQVRLNDRLVLDQPANFHPLDRPTLQLGVNPAGGTTTSVFSGALQKPRSQPYEERRSDGRPRRN